MKHILCLLAALGIGMPLRAQLRPSPPPPVEKYADIVAAVPREFQTRKAAKWTKAQREGVNAVLKKFCEAKRTAKLTYKVDDVANWPGLTLFGYLKNNEGQTVRIFAAFDEKLKPQLAKLKKGQTVTIEGILVSARWMDTWNVFGLDVCVQNCRLID